VHSVSPYPNTALAAWQLALIAVVALGGVAAWLGAVFFAAREPRARGHAAVPQSPAEPAEVSQSPAEPSPEPGLAPRAAA
jgi:hypothetical protein